MKPLIVTVEDDPVISELIVFNLENDGYDVKAYADGIEMLKAKDSFKEISLFVLDIMLPGIDGFEICKRIRETAEFETVPIIMLTAMGTEREKVKAFEIGADDYITKPFGVREFLARVNTNIRRFMKMRNLYLTPQNDITEACVSEKAPGDTLPGKIQIDDKKHRVYKDGSEIEMTNREYELLKFMMNNKGVAYSRDDLLNFVWGYDYSGETRTVDVHIRQLRRKIESDDANPKIIQTVRGRGYRFSEE